MGKKRAKLFFLLVAVSVMVTGCWDATEVNKLDLVTMVILNKQGEEFSFIAEIPNIMPASSERGSTGSKNAYITGSGADFPKARESLDIQLQKPLFLGTVRTLVITVKAAENDLAEYLFRLRENSTYRQKVTLVTTRDDPAVFTDVKGETDSPGGFAINDMISSLVRDGRTYLETTSHYVEDILSGRGFVIHCVDNIGNKHVLTGYTVFQNAKYIGFIPLEQANGLVFLLANNPAFIYRVPFKENFATVEAKLTGKKIIPDYKNGIIRFKLQMKYDATVQYVNQVQLYPLDQQALGEITSSLRQVLQGEIQNTILQSQAQFQCDYFDFSDDFRTAYPNVFEKLNWTEEYPKAQMELMMQIDLSVSRKMDYEYAE